METKKVPAWLEHPAAFVKWLIFAGISGLLCGGVATAFYYAFSSVTDLRHANPWLIWLLPVGGLAIVLLYRVCGMEGDRGTNFVLAAVRENQPLRLRTAPWSLCPPLSPIWWVVPPAGREPSSRLADLSPPK